MRFILFTAVSLLTSLVQAQISTPGGVGEPLHWLLVKTKTEREVCWLDFQKNKTDEKLPAVEPGFYFNNWGVPEWSAVRASTNLTVNDKYWEGNTLFIVYQTNEPQTEQTLWSWEPANRAPLLCTNQRMADLDQHHYLNRTNTDQQIRLQTFHQTNKTIGSSDGVFRIGQKPSFQQLPIVNWMGGIAEFIFYSRVLSPRQRLQVESYLALKYGITLEKGKDYVGSDGRILWDAKQQKDFHHRIFGLGCDEASRWQQYYGQSAESPDDIRISLTSAPAYNGLPGPAIPDQTSWILGDNEALLNWEDQTESQQILQRRWLLKTQGTANTLSTEIRVDLGRWLTTSTDDLTYFLAIDRSGKGSFADATTELIPISHLSRGRFGHFENIHWDTDDSGSDQFTIIRRGNLAQLNPFNNISLRVYPNPLSPQDHWQWQIVLENATHLKMTIANAQGQVLEEKSWLADTYFAEEQSPLPAGIYLLTFHYGNEKLTQKLIVQ